MMVLYKEWRGRRILSEQEVVDREGKNNKSIS